ncbi:8288_t:CDS:2, partial [Funneliformis geosporum]
QISKGTSKFGIENISAFPLRGYHIEKKSYIRVITWNQFDWYNALKAVREVDICTASDDLTPIYYYRKVACEKRLPLSSWATLSNYFHEYIQGGFNDSQYDWPFIMEKAKKLGVLELMFNHMSIKPMSLEKITKWQYQCNMIKVNNGNFYSRHLKTPRCVAINVQLCFKKFYPKAEKKTNATMTEQMREVAKYCIIDALSCQRLMIKHNVINGYREVASIAFISLFDTHYFAIGMKGLKNKHPVTGLDFASLYLSLIMTYNLSPDKIILSRKHAESLGDKHNNIPEEKGLYAKILEYLSSKWNEIKKRLAPLKKERKTWNW